MTERKNPYERIESVVEKTLDAALTIVCVGIVVAVLLVYPVVTLVTGGAWWQAFVFHFVVFGGIFLGYLVVRAEHAWNKRKDAWYKEQWAAEREKENTDA